MKLAFKRETLRTLSNHGLSLVYGLTGGDACLIQVTPTLLTHEDPDPSNIVTITDPPVSFANSCTCPTDPTFPTCSTGFGRNG